LKENLGSVLCRDACATLSALKDDSIALNCISSKSVISRHIKNINYTRKRLSIVPQERNAERTLDNRQIYAREVDNISDGNLIFLDETGFNLHLTKNYGYSPVNSKCYITVPGNKNTNISLLLAIKINGVVGYQIKEGGFNGDDLINFFRNKLLVHFNNFRNDILVMDNCRFHHRHDVKEYLIENRINFLYLPAYSPQLNPIEEYFSHLKAKYTSISPRPRVKREIVETVTRLVEEENIDFGGWFRNMRRWLERNSKAVF
jgi:transposase